MKKILVFIIYIMFGLNFCNNVCKSLKKINYFECDMLIK